ncbi:cytochrome P450 [Crassisporium funariophilum]|nr:cytochrome P450 [Crassisporium funariophilum]
MIVVLAQFCLLYAVSIALWKGYRRFFAKSPLDNVPGPPSKSFLTGVLPAIFSQNGWDYNTELAEKFGGVIKIKALLGENQLYVFDPKAMYHIIVKDSNAWGQTSSFIAMNNLAFGPGLLGTEGEVHRKQRKMLNPVFSVAHMREMVPIFYNVAYKLRDAFASKVKSGPHEIEVLSWMNRTAMELIGQSGLGVSFDPLTDDYVPHPYTASAKQFIPKLAKVIILSLYAVPVAVKIGTPKFRRFIVDHLPWRIARELRDIMDVLHNTSVEILESKKKALAEGDDALAKQIGQGKDIMSILLKANMNVEKQDSLSNEELLGQITGLTFAATDTTSGALARILHVLANDTTAQDRLRREVVEARNQQGDLPYDELVALPYLDAVIRETLRLYPPVSFSIRTAKEDVILPFSVPIKGVDGRDLQEVVVPKGTNVMISILAANRNREIWGPDAYEWKPERWLNPLPGSVTGAQLPGIYSHLMTFIGGSRACIGFKFSQLEMKVVLSLLLESFQFTRSGKKILWQMDGIAAPMVVNTDSDSRQLPLMVSLVNPVA